MPSASALNWMKCTAACNLPSKFKMGVSGCPNCCAESYIKDLGLIGTKKGWKLVVGGNAASRPALAQQVADELTDDEAMAAIDKIMNWYKDYPKNGDSTG
jgi:NAD(P)H-nitrite reductase large subunit